MLKRRARMSPSCNPNCSQLEPGSPGSRVSVSNESGPSASRQGQGLGEKPQASILYSFSPVPRLLSSPPARQGPLNIRKKRRLEKLDSDTCEVKPRSSALRPMSPPGNNDLRGSDDSFSYRTPNGNFVARNQRLRRSLTFSDYSRDFFGLSTNIHGTLGNAPTQVIGHGHRRTVSDRPLNRPEPIRLATIREYYKSPPPKLTSFKHRLLNRLASGFHSNNEPEYTIKEDRHAYLARDMQRCSIRTSTDSVASTETDVSFEKGLGSTIARFPTPPHASAIVPMVADTSPLKGQRSVLSAPTETAMMGANLVMIQEENTAQSIKSRSIFIAAEIQCLLWTPSNEFQNTSNRCKIDAVVVVDNSLFSSPTALMANCETATFVASILDIRRDRLAVLCTNGHRKNELGSKLVQPLRKIDMPQIRTCVDSINGCNKYPHSNYMRDAVASATQILRSSVAGDSPYTRRKATGHIFVLTANLGGLADANPTENEILVHAICPSAVPRRSSKQSTHNGWTIFQTLKRGTEGLSCQPIRKESNVQARLRDLVEQAHCGQHSRPLHDLQLSFDAGHNCVVEGIIGPSKIAVLRPGEHRTVLVKVRVGNVGQGVSRLARFPQGVRTDSGQLDVEKELDLMLEDRHCPILSTKLRYRHPALTEGTICEIVKIAEITAPTIQYVGRCSVREPERTFSRAKPATGQGKVPIQKRLVYHLASNQTPKNALSSIMTHFGPIPCSSCPDYIEAVTMELKYQARLTERFELEQWGGVCSSSPEQKHIRDFLNKNSSPQRETDKSPSRDHYPEQAPLKEQTNSKSRERATGWQSYWSGPHDDDDDDGETTPRQAVYKTKELQRWGAQAQIRSGVPTGCNVSISERAGTVEYGAEEMLLRGPVRRLTVINKSGMSDMSNRQDDGDGRE